MGEHDVSVAGDADEQHEGSWSANLETDAYEDDPERTVRDALDAVAATRPDFHVNLVTHGALGRPETVLFDALDAAFGDAIDYEFVDRCGCGGYVTRVHRNATDGGED